MSDELKHKHAELKRKIMTLEWDKSKNQINSARMAQLDIYKKELQDLEKELKN